MPPPPDRNVFQMPFAPRPGDIDELGHVNNAVYVRWLQDVATAHWVKLASPADVARYLWVATRHEIDYHRAILPDETVTARTWVGDPKGARFDRFVEFVDDQGRIRAAARTTWAIIDRKTGKPLRVPRELTEPFVR
ncbi:acyl-CoA thioesterase [Tardibacter chloracetimidivorans]|nr:acyl-CoA thioesterase [Tardibacter chloracetimidivorans]